MPFSAGEEPINAGDVVSLTCTITKGDSPISIHWLFNDTEIESNDEIQISKLGRKLSTLYIESARAQYMGEYTCVAKNAAGATNFSTSLHVNGLPICVCSAKTLSHPYPFVFLLPHLKVNFASVLPQIIPFSAGEDPINAGDSVSLQCSVSKGDSPIAISWLFNNTEIESSDDIVINKASKKVTSLIIDSARASHVGAYTCLAKNAAGANNFTTYLHINGLQLFHIFMLFAFNIFFRIPFHHPFVFFDSIPQSCRKSCHFRLEKSPSTQGT